MLLIKYKKKMKNQYLHSLNFIKNFQNNIIGIKYFNPLTYKIIEIQINKIILNKKNILRIIILLDIHKKDFIVLMEGVNR